MVVRESKCNEIINYLDENGLTDDELEHYGRLGMKWGMHIYGEDKTYRKSMTKLGQQDKKITKKKKEADYHSTRGDAMRAKANSSWTASGARRSNRKANRAYKRAYKRTKQSNRAYRRANRIVKAMNKEFADKKISSFTNEDVMLGKKYCIDVLNRAMRDARLYEED